ncbi:MAG: sulfite exporter TauE/SafE family protein [Ilumatobacteraceae bacterium]
MPGPDLTVSVDLMTVGETLAVLGAVLVASTTQVTVGFGFALLAVPVMSLAVPTHDAVIISTILGLLTSSFQAHHGRRDTDRTLVRRLILSSCVGIPMGLLLFQRVDERVLRGVLGASVLGAVVFLTSRRPVRSSVGLDWVCGVLSGALASSLSTNGPPLVFVLQARELPMSVFRPTINTVFTASGVISLIAFIVGGDVDGDTVIHALLAVPVLIIGSRVGFLLRGRVPESGARRLVLILLALAGVSALVAAFA